MCSDLIPRSFRMLDYHTIYDNLFFLHFDPVYPSFVSIVVIEYLFIIKFKFNSWQFMFYYYDFVCLFLVLETVSCYVLQAGLNYNVAQGGLKLL